MQASPKVDFAALAKKYGGVTMPNYAEAARRHGGITVPTASLLPESKGASGAAKT
jgi:hypothetical protein